MGYIIILKLDNKKAKRKRSAFICIVLIYLFSDNTV